MKASQTVLCSEEHFEFVYFALAPATGLVKIGYSSTPLQRVRALNCITVGIVHGDRKFEASLHDRFADVRQGGEWFLRSAAVQRYVSAARRRKARSACEWCEMRIAATRPSEEPAAEQSAVAPAEPVEIPTPPPVRRFTAAVLRAQKEVMEEAYRVVGNNNSAVSRYLGIARSRVIELRKQFQI
jgi:hypothetical protein